MKMVAQAANKNTGIRHKLRDGGLPETNIAVPKDGKSLTITTSIVAEKGLTGEFFLDLTFSKAEVEMMAELLVTRPLLIEIRDLKAQIAKEKLLTSTPL